MQRLAIWIILGAIYGGILAALVQFMGQAGAAVWLVLVVVAQLWLGRMARRR